jgi:hypothetical protein
VIKAVANAVRAEAVTPKEINFLTGFSLPLSAKRALDYSGFFEKHNRVLSDLKYQMAQRFGEAQSVAMAKAWPEFADTLNKLADLENKVEQELS